MNMNFLARVCNFNAGRMYHEQQHIFNADSCGLISHAPGYAFAPFYAGERLLGTLDFIFDKLKSQRSWAKSPVGFGYNTFPSTNCAPRSNQPYSGWSFYYHNEHLPAWTVPSKCLPYRVATNFAYNYVGSTFPYVHNKLIF